MSNTLSPSDYAGSVLVPNYGWVIFGGFQNRLLTTQRLQSLSGKWESGPNLYQSKSDWYQCCVQVNTKFTAICFFYNL